MVDFAVKMDTKLNKMLDRIDACFEGCSDVKRDVECLGQELHSVKDAVAVLQEGEQSALVSRLGEKLKHSMLSAPNSETLKAELALISKGLIWSLTIGSKVLKGNLIILERK